MTKKPVHELILEVLHELGTDEVFSISEVVQMLSERGYKANKSTVRANIIADCINDPSRKHYSGSGEDRFFKVAPGKYKKLTGHEQNSEHVEEEISTSVSDKYYDAEEVEGKYMEVILTDEEGEEYVYWVNIENMPEDEDEYDWPIEIAVDFHNKQLDLPKLSEDEAEAMEPFSRSESEFKFVG